jgi:hypothetical protein
MTGHRQLLFLIGGNLVQLICHFFLDSPNFLEAKHMQRSELFSSDKPVVKNLCKFNQSTNIFSNCYVFIFRIILITSCLSSGKSSNLCPRRNDLMYGNTAKCREKLTFTTVDVVERQDFFPCSGYCFLN